MPSRMSATSYSSIDCSKIAAMSRRMGWVSHSRSVIPGNTYPSNAEAVTTLGVRTAIVTTTRLPETVAYEITKALFENIDDFRRLHPDFATLLPHDMFPGAGGVPVHTGAARYYRARGWLP